MIFKSYFLSQVENAVQGQFGGFKRQNLKTIVKMAMNNHSKDVIRKKSKTFKSVVQNVMKKPKFADVVKQAVEQRKKGEKLQSNQLTVPLGETCVSIETAAGWKDSLRVDGNFFDQLQILGKDPPNSRTRSSRRAAGGTTEADIHSWVENTSSQQPSVSTLPNYLGDTSAGVYVIPNIAGNSHQ